MVEQDSLAIDKVRYDVARGLAGSVANILLAACHCCESASESTYTVVERAMREVFTRQSSDFLRITRHAAPGTLYLSTLTFDRSKCRDVLTATANQRMIACGHSCILQNRA